MVTFPFIVIFPSVCTIPSVEIEEPPNVISPLAIIAKGLLVNGSFSP